MVFLNTGKNPYINRAKRAGLKPYPKKGTIRASIATVGIVCPKVASPNKNSSKSLIKGSLVKIAKMRAAIAERELETATIKMCCLAISNRLTLARKKLFGFIRRIRTFSMISNFKILIRKKTKSKIVTIKKGGFIFFIFWHL